MTLKGDFTRYEIPARDSGRPVLGPDGAIWFTDGQANAIVRITP